MAFAYNFGARMYDARLGRWMSRDPLANEYPRMSPYHFTANNPVYNIEVDGRYFVSYSERNGFYSIHVTNHYWIENATNLSAIPYFGLIFEASLWSARGQDPSFDATKSDYRGLVYQIYGAGSLKLISKLGKVKGLAKVVLESGRELNSTLNTIMNDPNTAEVGIDYLAALALEGEDIGFFDEDESGGKMTNQFYFDKSFVKGIENDILNDEELTSKEDFNLRLEVEKRLSTIMENKKEEIRTALLDAAEEEERD